MNVYKSWRNVGRINKKVSLPTFEEILELVKIDFNLTGMRFDGQTSWWFPLPFFCVASAVFEEFIFIQSKIAPENVLELSELAPCTAMGVLSMLKIGCIFLKRNKLFRLTHDLETLYSDMKRDSTKCSVIEKEVLWIKWLTKYYLILNVVLITVFNFSTVVVMLYHYLITKEVKFRVPYSVITPYNGNTWIGWIITYLHLIASGFICVIYYTTTDAMFFIFTSQVCCNLKVLSNDLKHFKSNEDGSLNVIVKKHQNILKLSEDLEEVFSGPNFFSVLIGSILICVLGFNVTTGGWAEVAGFILFLSSVLLQILMMSMFGENLISESQNIADSAFQCTWYEMDLKTKKNLLIIRERAKRPQQLTAFKFSVISYSSFSKIISTSWSYFTILRTVYKPSDEHQQHDVD